MKHLYSIILLACMLAVSAFLRAANDSDGGVQSSSPTFKSSPLRNVLEGELSCPSNTVYSEAVDLSVPGMKGICRSDRGYADISCQTYQSFEGVVNPVQGIRVFAISLPKNFLADNARFNLDADGKMTKPIRLAVAFYEMGSGGMPGKEVYREEFDAIGEMTKAVYDNRVNIYSFTLNFSEKVRLETGFVSVFAVDDGTRYESSFALIHDSSITHAGLIMSHYWDKDKDDRFYGGCFNFCFLGDKNEGLASKGLKLQRVLSPQSTERGQYAKVQVELKNYGSQNVADATLNLYEGDQLLATETVGEVIYSGTSYKYTFRKRLDCSSVGLYTFRIENVTPGDEYLASKSIDFSTSNLDGDCQSSASYNGPYKYIRSVSIGGINNESSYSVYSDFRDHKTDIKPGETLRLAVDTKANNGDYIKVWVDWNGNGLFDDEGEFMGYVPKSNLDVAIPANVHATAGEKTMRIIVSDEDVSPCTNYTYGETEDYILNVVRPDGAAALDADLTDIVFKASDNETESKSLDFANSGEGTLDATLSVEYRLPQSPDVNSLTKAPALADRQRPEVSHTFATALQSRQASMAPRKADDQNPPLVLTYGDGKYNGNTGSKSVYVSYAHYYPASALKSIKGMTISSIDVYIASAARKSSVTVWRGGGLQSMTGDVLSTQVFTPVPNSWNHVELSSPVTVTGDIDLFVGCALEGCKNVDYLVGTDVGPANTGFGDLISIEKSNYWWSLADLGYNNNVLIKANVTGKRTPAVDWLSIDKNTLSLAPGSNEKLTLTANSSQLAGDLFEAAVKVVSNDPLATSVKLPVYLDLNDKKTGVSVLEGDGGPQFRISDGRSVTVLGGKAVGYIALFTVDGRQMAMAFGTNTVSAASLGRGVYIVKSVFDDGTQAKATILIK